MGRCCYTACCYLSGYDLPLEEIKHFRKWGSKAAGHPERGLTPGVEVTTGPLGQGFGNGVGLAIAEAWLAARYNRPGHKIVDHYTYAICGDGDLMEGVSQEAASLAGHLRLGKLIYLYDQNHISLAGATEIDFTEDVAKRFEACGWHTRVVPDGNDTEDVARAIREAQAEDQRPSLILARTHIGYGSPHKQDNFTAHGDPLGEEELQATKKALGWPTMDKFYLPAGLGGLFPPGGSSWRANGGRVAEEVRRIQASVSEGSRRVREHRERQAPAKLGRRSPQMEAHR